MARLYQPAWYRSCSRVWNDSHQCVCSASTLRRRLCRFEPDRTNSASDRIEVHVRAAVDSDRHGSSSNADAHSGNGDACAWNDADNWDARLDWHHAELDHGAESAARYNDAAAHESSPDAGDKSSPDDGDKSGRAADKSGPDAVDKSGPDAGAGLTAGCRSGGNRDVDDYYGDTCPKAVGPRASATL